MIAPNWYPDDKQLRWFSLGCCGAGALLGYMVLHATNSVTWGYVLAGLGVTVFVIGLVRPALVRPAYYALLAITFPIGWLISNSVLILIFYGFMTPLGLVFRLLGRDALMLKKPQVSSYWREHGQRKDVESYFRQT